MKKEGIKEQGNIDYYMQLPYSLLLHELEDEGEKYWIAEIVELPGCRSHGSTVSEAVENVQEAKKDWILDGLDRGEEIPLPIERRTFSGKTLVRMSRSLHRALALIAESENLSLNQLIVTILAKEVGRLNVLNRVESKLDKLLGLLSTQLEYNRLKEPTDTNLRRVWALAGIGEYESFFTSEIIHSQLSSNSWANSQTNDDPSYPSSKSLGESAEAPTRLADLAYRT